jgi:hypothetical protein
MARLFRATMSAVGLDMTFLRSARRGDVPVLSRADLPCHGRQFNSIDLTGLTEAWGGLYLAPIEVRRSPGVDAAASASAHETEAARINGQGLLGEETP